MYLTDLAGVTIRPSHQAGPLPAKRVRKKKPCYTRSTTRTGQAWRHVDVNGKLLPVKCPGCGSVIEFDKRGFAGCGTCALNLSEKDYNKWLAEIEARDPEMAPVVKFQDHFEQFAPRFEGNQNRKKISGKERRVKRLLSKCAMVS